MPPASHNSYGLPALGAAAYAYYTSSTTPDPSAPLPAGVPADSKFFFGSNGDTYYISATGVVSRVDRFGFVSPVVLAPGSGIATDSLQACTWTPINRGTTSPGAGPYSQYVTGVPFGLECMSNGVAFDGFDYTKGAYLEAKWNYDQFFNDDLTPKSWFNSGAGLGYDSLVRELQNQVTAANGRKLEWHISGDTPQRAQKAYDAFVRMLNDTTEARLDAARAAFGAGKLVVKMDTFLWQ